jgi:hypothetical protein
MNSQVRSNSLGIQLLKLFFCAFIFLLVVTVFFTTSIGYFTIQSLLKHEAFTPEKHKIIFSLLLSTPRFSYLLYKKYLPDFSQLKKNKLLIFLDRIVPVISVIFQSHSQKITFPENKFQIISCLKKTFSCFLIVVLFVVSTYIFVSAFYPWSVTLKKKFILDVICLVFIKESFVFSFFILATVFACWIFLKLYFKKNYRIKLKSKIAGILFASFNFHLVSAMLCCLGGFLFLLSATACGRMHYFWLISSILLIFYALNIFFSFILIPLCKTFLPKRYRRCVFLIASLCYFLFLSKFAVFDSFL